MLRYGLPAHGSIRISWLNNTGQNGYYGQTGGADWGMNQFSQHPTQGMGDARSTSLQANTINAQDYNSRKWDSRDTVLATLMTWRPSVSPQVLFSGQHAHTPAAPRPLSTAHHPFPYLMAYTRATPRPTLTPTIRSQFYIREFPSLN
jgi:hypothetical protein